MIASTAQRLLPIETLFFSVYFQAGTFAQRVAIDELKRRSWRFHISQRTWLRRAGMPTALMPTGECGPYLYFDASHFVTRLKAAGACA